MIIPLLIAIFVVLCFNLLLLYTLIEETHNLCDETRRLDVKLGQIKSLISNFLQ